jgi:hypothetical protein
VILPMNTRHWSLYNINIILVTLSIDLFYPISHCFLKGNKNSGRRLCIMVCPSFWEDYYMFIYTHCLELMNSVGSHGSSSLLFVMKVMVCPFVNNSHEVMTALIVVLPLIIVMEIFLQLHRFSCDIEFWFILSYFLMVNWEIIPINYLWIIYKNNLELSWT